MPTVDQYRARLVEWMLDAEAFDVFDDLVDNGFAPGEAFRVTLDLESL